MAKEAIYFDEEHLEDVIHIIRTGLANTACGLSDRSVDESLRKDMYDWCDELEEYLNRD